MSQVSHSSGMNTIKNHYGFKIEDFHPDRPGFLFDRGIFYVNLTNSRIPVTGINDEYLGSIHPKESFVYIGRSPMDGKGNGHNSYMYVAFTGPDNNLTVGCINSCYSNDVSRWENHPHGRNSKGEILFKTYNRNINFFGHTCPPGTYVVPSTIKDCDIDIESFTYSSTAGVTVPLTSLSKVNLISIKAVKINGSYVESPYLIDGTDHEYASTAVVTRGTNCDVEGKW